MGYHTFDADRADKLEDAQQRYRFLSAEELLWALSPDSDETVADFASAAKYRMADFHLIGSNLNQQTVLSTSFVG